ncbi:hypothetical protein BT93_J0574 [Corymbia citriodora subsp. variegata]|nr:hypothetical protein BT93_J0574 [Corymbia citriodora subsp. variegata]
MGVIQTTTKNAIIVEKSVPVAVLPEEETPGGFLFLSNLDQKTVFFVSLVYSFDRSDVNTIDVIKQALSKVLVHNYPLAGRLDKNSQGKLIVDCNKKLGVTFVETSAKCDIKNLGDMRLLDSNVLQKLVTNFGCGSFTVGISLNHCMFDGTSVVNFMNSWAEIARGKPISLFPRHERSVLKSKVPAQTTYASEGFVPASDVSNLTALYEEGQIVHKSFHFNIEKLAILKKMATADGQVTSTCSNFVALAALVWRARSMALKMKPHQLSKLIFGVDFRSKMKPPMPRYIGNAVVGAYCLCTAGELIGEPISSTVGRIKKAMERVNEDYVRSWIDCKDMFESDFLSLSSLGLTSWQRFDYGSTDFGWGKSRDFGIGDLPRTSCLFLTEGSQRNGILVVLGLPLSAMNTLEKLLQLLPCERETPSMRSKARL